MTHHSHSRTAVPPPLDQQRGLLRALSAPDLSPAELWLQRANAAHTAALDAFRGNPSHRNRQRLSDACLERVNAYNRAVLAREGRL